MGNVNTTAFIAVVLLYGQGYAWRKQSIAVHDITLMLSTPGKARFHDHNMKE